ncbi:UdgX family uracil-DNA binding protein [Lysobacter sp. N42]|uniref:UdgX family uracil-DNA binding protein n=1 Tax=Lysobacter sp. N42 TaxID=2545719 RepID=UPI001FB78D7B|nr:UdgX family uracil-DNA binding protein [Lysobacter sp. N42]
MPRAQAGRDDAQPTLRARGPSRTRIPQVPEGTAPEPAGSGLAAIREAAAYCKRCDLWRPATQTVFGEGPARARVVLVGEQLGDREDIADRPFVGPAGRLLDQALAELGIDRDRLYLTNAVKHVKFEPRGKARIHTSPTPAEQKACHLWRERELAAIRPRVVVALGAIGAKAVFGAKFGLMRPRGQWQELPDGRRGFATVHPSWVLRQRDSGSREQAYRSFRDDLALLADLDD